MTTLWDSIKKGLKDSAKIAKEGAAVAAEKAEELGKKSKVMIEISNVKRKIEKQFTELGGKVYHAMAEEKATDFSEHEEINGFIKAIKELENELSDKQQELEHIGKIKEEETEMGETSVEDSDEAEKS
ncbi:hypothetical protein ACFL4Q_02980 [candidate division KSB1 bacterium]